MTNWKEIENEFETLDITMKDLAEKHNVKPSTLRSRKNREGWTKKKAKKKTKQRKKDVATQRNKKKNVATQKAIQELNDNDELTEKRKRFCLLYLKYFNATKAYQEAYECDYKTANANGSRLLAIASIKEELSRLKKQQQSELYIDSLDIKKEWLKQAFANINDYVDYGTEEVLAVDHDGLPMLNEDGEHVTIKKPYVHFKNQDELDGSLIEEVKLGRDGPVVKLYDKQKAMDRLMEFLQIDEESSVEDKVVFMTDTSEMEKWVEENGGL